MSQPSLFGDLCRHPSPAATPRVCTAEAREAAALVRGALHAAILAYLREHGPATDEEMQEALSMNPSTQRPRRGELVTAGKVRAVGVGKTRSGRSATTWGLV